MYPLYQQLAQALPGGTLALGALLQNVDDPTPWAEATRDAARRPSLDEALALLPAEQLVWLRRFLVAATLKDCSVVLALAPSTSEADGSDRLQDDGSPGVRRVVLPDGTSLGAVYRLTGTLSALPK